MGVAAPFRRSTSLLLDGIARVALICLSGSKLTIKHPGWGGVREGSANKKYYWASARPCISKKKSSREGIDRCLNKA